MLKRLLMSLVLLINLPLLGCQSIVSSKINVPFEILRNGNVPNNSSPENFTEIDKSIYVLLTSPGDLTRYLNIKTKDPDSDPWPPKELNQIDFNKEIGMLITRGRQGIGGTGLEVEKIQWENSDVYVRIKMINPKGPQNTTVESYNLKLLKLSKEHLPKGNVKFIFTDQDGNILNQQEVTL